jgi:hypothetical protein
MDLKLLSAPHKLREGDAVVITDMKNNRRTFNGTIYRIINAPVNKYLAPYNSIFVDQFYIKFKNEDYPELLSRGLDIIYNHRPAILGNVVRTNNSQNITAVYSQNSSPGYYSETQIDVNNINAILVWRCGFEIRSV